MPSIDGKLLRVEFTQIPNGGWFQSRKKKGTEEFWQEFFAGSCWCL